MAIDIIALIISVLALGLSGFQFIRDSSRSKIEATLNAYHELQETSFDPLNDILRKLRDDGKLDNNGYIDIDVSNEYWEALTGCLAKIENFSVGINTGLYSLDILNKVGGGYFIRIYNELSLIIDKKAKMNISGGKHYDQFKKTVDDLIKLRSIQKTDKTP